jgi:hypothetical protein
MNILDKNQTLEPPAGYVAHAVIAEGAYLRLEYRQVIFREGTIFVRGWNVATIYLNDMGREVARTIVQTYLPEPVTKPEAVVSVGRWFRFKNGFLIAIQGLQEMFR